MDEYRRPLAHLKVQAPGEGVIKNSVADMFHTMPEYQKQADRINQAICWVKGASGPLDFMVVTKWFDIKDSGTTNKIKQASPLVEPAIQAQ